MTDLQEGDDTQKDKIQFIGFFLPLVIAIFVTGFLWNELWTYYLKPIIVISLIGTALFFGFGYNRKLKVSRLPDSEDVKK